MVPGITKKKPKTTPAELGSDADDMVVPQPVVEKDAATSSSSNQLLDDVNVVDTDGQVEGDGQENDNSPKAAYDNHENEVVVQPLDEPTTIGMQSFLQSIFNKIEDGMLATVQAVLGFVTAFAFSEIFGINKNDDEDLAVILILMIINGLWPGRKNPRNLKGFGSSGSDLGARFLVTRMEKIPLAVEIFGEAEVREVLRPGTPDLYHGIALPGAMRDLALGIRLNRSKGFSIESTEKYGRSIFQPSYKRVALLVIFLSENFIIEPSQIQQLIDTFVVTLEEMSNQDQLEVINNVAKIFVRSFKGSTPLEDLAQKLRASMGEYALLKVVKEKKDDDNKKKEKEKEEKVLPLPVKKEEKEKSTDGSSQGAAPAKNDAKNDWWSNDWSGKQWGKTSSAGYYGGWNKNAWKEKSSGGWNSSYKQSDKQSGSSSSSSSSSGYKQSKRSPSPSPARRSKRSRSRPIRRPKKNGESDRRR
jgi:hypothetical protein